MQTWKQVSDTYENYLTNNVAVPKIRLSSLVKIEKYLNELYPGITKGNISFLYIDRDELKKGYERWKGKDLNGAEKQVFNDFYKIGTL